jgi:hypothetical protein
LGIRNLQTREYLGFDNFNEEIEEPWKKSRSAAL